MRIGIPVRRPENSPVGLQDFEIPVDPRERKTPEIMQGQPNNQTGSSAKNQLIDLVDFDDYIGSLSSHVLS